MFVKAKRMSASPLAFTFYPHPCDVLTGRHLPLILPFDMRVKWMRRLGLEVVVIKFTRDLSRMTARKFLDLLKQEYGIRRLVVGEDFRLGSDQVPAKDLPEWFEVVPRLCWRGEEISASRIRDALAQGDIDSARSMLGYIPRLWGRVVRGEGVGRRIGFPTANLRLASDLLLKEGVYIVRVSVGKGHIWGLMSIGRKPTLGERDRVFVEIHLVGFDGDLYNRELEVKVYRFLRPQIRFDNMEGLKAQLKRDVVQLKAHIRRQPV